MTDVYDVLAPVVTEAGLFLESAKITPAGKKTTLKVTVDLPEGPGGVTSDQLTEVSRAISSFLDTSPAAPAGEYMLEVTTPGATRKLETERHFGRALGRYVIVHCEGTQHRGLLKSVQGGKITVSIDEVDHDFDLSSIDRARMDVNL